jgi:hypothetical protein
MDGEAALHDALTALHHHSEVEVAQHAVQVHAWGQIVSGIRTLRGSRPQGVEAVRLVMMEGGVWTAHTMFEELRRRGWEPKASADPLRAVGATMSRMSRKRAEIVRVGHGQYRYKVHHLRIVPWAAPTA